MLTKKILKIFKDLSCLFFPNSCILCGNPLVEGEEEICLNCLTDLPYTHFTQLENQNVTNLFIGKATIVNAVAMFHFEKGGHVQKMIHAIKYRHNRRLAVILGRLTAMEIHEKLPLFFQDIDAIIPVPLHPSRQRIRGYNQSELIAQGIQEITHLPIINDLLIRTHSNESQTRKQAYERYENVKDIFFLNEKQDIQNKHFLIVDDVITTGATLSACAQTLNKIPHTNISLLGIAIAK